MTMERSSTFAPATTGPGMLCAWVNGANPTRIRAAGTSPCRSFCMASASLARCASNAMRAASVSKLTAHTDMANNSFTTPPG